MPPHSNHVKLIDKIRNIYIGVMNNRGRWRNGRVNGQSAAGRSQGVRGGGGLRNLRKESKVSHSTVQGERKRGTEGGLDMEKRE